MHRVLPVALKVAVILFIVGAFMASVPPSPLAAWVLFMLFLVLIG